MTTQTQVTPLAIEDYEAIEAAVMETTRGRWFLAEYARRNRNSDTDAVLTALDRIERTMRRDRAAPDIDRIRLDLADMAEAISRTKQEIAQMKLDTAHGGRFADASHELDAIVSQTETATNEILRAAETIQETAWTLREAGAADELCDKLDVESTEIYTACSFQDLTGQRTRKVVTVLRYLESRINAMMSIWGLEEVEEVPTTQTAPVDPNDSRPDAHLLNGPQLHGRGMGQGAVDDLMWNDAELAEAEQPPTEEPPVFAPADEPPAIVEIEAAADVFAAPLPESPAPAQALETDLDLSAADVFSSEATGRIAAGVRDRRDVEEESEPEPFAAAPVTVVVGNTLVSAALEAIAETDTAPALAVVEAVDPIATLSPRARLVTFG